MAEVVAQKTGGRDFWKVEKNFVTNFLNAGVNALCVGDKKIGLVALRFGGEDKILRVVPRECFADNVMQNVFWTKFDFVFFVFQNNFAYV